MAIYGSNTFEWETATKVVVQSDGKVVHLPSVRIRHKDTIVSVLGASLGIWSNWRWIDDDPVYRLPDGTLCDSQGEPI